MTCTFLIHDVVQGRDHIDIKWHGSCICAVHCVGYTYCLRDTYKIHKYLWLNAQSGHPGRANKSLMGALQL